MKLNTDRTYLKISHSAYSEIQGGVVVTDNDSSLVRLDHLHVCVAAAHMGQACMRHAVSCDTLHHATRCIMRHAVSCDTLHHACNRHALKLRSLSQRYIQGHSGAFRGTRLTETGVIWLTPSSIDLQILLQAQLGSGLRLISGDCRC